MAALWTAGGFLSWLSALYLFTYVLSPITSPTVSFAQDSIVSIIAGYTLVFLIMHVSDYLMALLFSTALATATGRNTIWIIGFIVGAVGYTVYVSSESLIYYLDYFDALPTWALVAWSESMISSFIIVPLLSLLGVHIGIKLRKRRAERSRPIASTG